MRYFDYLESQKEYFIDRIESALKKYQVQPVGSGYIDCIVLKADLDGLMNELSEIGLLVTDTNWWCHVDPNRSDETSCPHGMGGPISNFHAGWFSELQNDFFSINDSVKNSILNNYDLAVIKNSNKAFTEGIKKVLEVPFRYTPTEYIEGNRCVVSALWILVPEAWKRK